MGMREAFVKNEQLDLKVLWDGHLARPNLGGQDAHPTRDKGFQKKSCIPRFVKSEQLSKGRLIAQDYTTDSPALR
jgi:hypothetical protein